VDDGVELLADLITPMRGRPRTPGPATERRRHRDRPRITPLHQNGLNQHPLGVRQIRSKWKSLRCDRALDGIS
jgi:hypothetical protein